MVKVTIEMTENDKWIFDTDELNEPFKTIVLQKSEEMVTPFRELFLKTLEENPDDI